MQLINKVILFIYCFIIMASLLGHSPLKEQGRAANTAWKGRVQKVFKGFSSLHNFFTRSCLEKKRSTIPLGGVWRGKVVG